MLKKHFRFVLILLLLAAAIPFSSRPSRAQEFTRGPIKMEHPYAPFLESRAYAASVGGTAEFRKMEYVVIDAPNRKLYIAMAEITQGMADDLGVIRLPENRCGIVYEADLDENWDITEMRPLVVGGPFDREVEGDRCHVANVAGPDNLAVDQRGRIWIGEDSSGNRVNNMLWVYDPADLSLKRFATVPLGAEVTGLRITDNGTLFFNVQHPDSDNPYPYDESAIGVVVGFNANTDDFRSVDVPSGNEELLVSVAAGRYQILGRSGDLVPGEPNRLEYGDLLRHDGSIPSRCRHPDGNFFIPTNAAGTAGSLYTNFECRPGGIVHLNIQQGEDGWWQVLEGEILDFLPIRGTWNNCGGSITPWGSVLSGEEYDIRTRYRDSIEKMTRYLGYAANPYDYGYIVELTPQTDGSTQIVKHYAMGRKSNESAWIAPDNRTAYFGDDESDAVLFKFIADVPGDLSAGTLYGARVIQTGNSNHAHAFQIEWIELGHGVDAEIEAAVRAMDTDWPDITEDDEEVVDEMDREGGVADPPADS